MKDAVMTKDEILKIYKDRKWLIFEPDLRRALTIAEAQDKLSIKAGMQEVVKFANHFAGIKHNPEWKAQKKEWGL